MSQQSPLFDDDTPSTAVVRVGIVGSQKVLTRAQKAFNRWTARIDKQRIELAAWRDCQEAIRTRLTGELLPLQKQLHDLRVAVLRRFDQACDGGALSKREQTRLGRLIREQAAALLEDSTDPALVSLHDKYSDLSHEALREQEAAALKARLEAMLGTSLGDDVRTSEEVLRAAEQWVSGGRDGAANGPFGEASREGQADRGDRGDQGYQGHQAEQADQAASTAGGRTGDRTREAGADAGGDPWARADGSDADGPRPRSARARARLEREQALAEGATRSLRETWRRLASLLHPDREPDPVERARKTALMQRANQAYEARDLMQLLALQLEASQIDLKALADAHDERIEAYNRLLKEQSEALAGEIEEIIAGFEMTLADPRAKVTPARILDSLGHEIAGVRRDCRGLTHDLEQFRDILWLKAWLKALPSPRERRRYRDVDDDLADVDPLDVLGAVLAAVATGQEASDEHGPAAKRGRRTRRKTGR